MTSWDDCVALVKAGASPEEVLPNVRTFLESAERPPSNEQASGDENGPLQVPVGSRRLSIPFLRTPFFVWDLLRDLEDGFELDRNAFDSEVDIDILSRFEPRTVMSIESKTNQELLLNEKEFFGDPRTTNKALENQGNAEATDGEKHHSPKTNSAALGANIAAPTNTRTYAETLMVIESVVEPLARLLNSASPMPDPSSSDYLFPELSEDEWVLALSKRSPEDHNDSARVRHAILVINQVSFARVVLQSLLPQVAASSDGESFDLAVDTAVSVAEISKCEMEQIAAMLNAFIQVSADEKGTKASMCIVRALQDAVV